MLTSERLRELLDYDPETGVFTWRVNASSRAQVGSVAGSPKAKGYRGIRVEGRSYYEHRLAWLHIHGEWPASHMDHINGVRDDNRLVNLREATATENQQNRIADKRNTSGVLGVSWCSRDGKWLAQIRLDGKRKYLGRFDTVEEAGAAYAEAKKQLHRFQPVMR